MTALRNLDHRSPVLSDNSGPPEISWLHPPRWVSATAAPSGSPVVHLGVLFSVLAQLHLCPGHSSLSKDCRPLETEHWIMNISHSFWGSSVTTSMSTPGGCFSSVDFRRHIVGLPLPLETHFFSLHLSLPLLYRKLNFSVSLFCCLFQFMTLTPHLLFQFSTCLVCLFPPPKKNSSMARQRPTFGVRSQVFVEWLSDWKKSVTLPSSQYYPSPKAYLFSFRLLH